MRVERHAGWWTQNAQGTFRAAVGSIDAQTLASPRLEPSAPPGPRRRLVDLNARRGAHDVADGENPQSSSKPFTCCHESVRQSGHLHAKSGRRALTWNDLPSRSRSPARRPHARGRCGAARRRRCQPVPELRPVRRPETGRPAAGRSAASTLGSTVRLAELNDQGESPLRTPRRRWQPLRASPRPAVAPGGQPGVPPPAPSPRCPPWAILRRAGPRTWPPAPPRRHAPSPPYGDGNPRRFHRERPGRALNTAASTFLVTVDGAPLDWRASLAVRSHSPTGPVVPADAAAVLVPLGLLRLRARVPLLGPLPEQGVRPTSRRPSRPSSSPASTPSPATVPHRMRARAPTGLRRARPRRPALTRPSGAASSSTVGRHAAAGARRSRRTALALTLPRVRFPPFRCLRPIGAAGFDPEGAADGLFGPRTADSELGRRRLVHCRPGTWNAPVGGVAAGGANAAPHLLRPSGVQPPSAASPPSAAAELEGLFSQSIFRASAQVPSSTNGQGR